MKKYKQQYDKYQVTNHLNDFMVAFRKWIALSNCKRLLEQTAKTLGY